MQNDKMKTEKNSETCVYKIRALRDIALNERIEHCRLCTKKEELECPDYKPISAYQEPIRQGYNAYLIMSDVKRLK